MRGTKTRPQLVDKLLGQYLKYNAGVLVDPWTGEEHQGVHIPMITQEEYRRILFVRSGKAFTEKTKPVQPRISPEEARTMRCLHPATDRKCL